MIRFIQCLIHKIPFKINDLWYNRAVHMSEHLYPIVFDVEELYIDCKVGQEVVMGVTPNGRKILYKITKVWQTRGGDWLYPSDALHCDMKFSRLITPDIVIRK